MIADSIIQTHPYVFVSYYLAQKSVLLINKLNRTNKIRLNPKQGARKE
jgi:hypothetical protein